MNKVSKYLNELSESEVQSTLEKCCATRPWIDRMAASRPFADDWAVKSAATEIWNSLPPDGWLQAFEAHPRIGDAKSLQTKFGNTSGWAAGEQSGAATAGEATISRLAAGNDAYFQKFGYIFIVCATGKSAEQMLEILEARLVNHADEELQIAAAEQLKITMLRLNKLVPDIGETSGMVN